MSDNPGPIAATSQPPYYAVIFTSVRTETDQGYAEMAGKMEALARKQPGFLGVESAREGVGITVSYWDSLEAIQKWRANVDHQLAQKSGRSQWYQRYKVRVAEVSRDYEFIQPAQGA